METNFIYYTKDKRTNQGLTEFQDSRTLMSTPVSLLLPSFTDEKW